MVPKMVSRAASQLAAHLFLVRFLKIDTVDSLCGRVDVIANGFHAVGARMPRNIKCVPSLFKPRDHLHSMLIGKAAYGRRS